MGKIIDSFGELVFNHKEMKQRLGSSVFEKYMSKVKEGHALDQRIAEDIARAMKEWAIEKEKQRQDNMKNRLNRINETLSRLGWK